ncbi:hypothetical protein N7G274_010709 [Stereocaulon virgatum]|uniref:Uncharacterized protein n=1 Tax=Stereocaulon virgatum TaxID=373712 RepID=A0ABR3ZV22_9LECA
MATRAQWIAPGGNSASTDMVDTLDLIDLSLISLPPASSPPIPELSVHLFYRCTLANCGGASASCSQQREIIVKHQSKPHRVGVRKAIKPDKSAIELVSIQCLWSLYGKT